MAGVFVVQDDEPQGSYDAPTPALKKAEKVQRTPGSHPGLRTHTGLSNWLRKGDALTGLPLLAWKGELIGNLNRGAAKCDP